MGSHNVFNKTYGPLLSLTCPFCEETADYLLVKKLPGLFLMAWLNIGCTWVLRCAACNQEVDVDDDEVNKARELVRCTTMRREERMNEEAYVNRINACRLRCLEEIHSRNLHWACPECEAEVPLSFHNCWQCGTRHPEAPEPGEDEDQDQEPRGLPMIIIHDPLDGTQIYSTSRQPKPPQG